MDTNLDCFAITEIAREHRHRVGVALSNGPVQGFAWAVVEAGTGALEPRAGRVVAWDGWYGPIGAPTVPAEYLAPIDADPAGAEGAGTVARALQHRNAAWISAVAGDLHPYFSMGRKARSIIASHGDSTDPLKLKDARVVADFPTELQVD